MHFVLKRCTESLPFLKWSVMIIPFDLYIETPEYGFCIFHTHHEVCRQRVGWNP